MRYSADEGDATIQPGGNGPLPIEPLTGPRMSAIVALSGFPIRLAPMIVNADLEALWYGHRADVRRRPLTSSFPYRFARFSSACADFGLGK